jgi:hypothetical protein
MALLADHDDGLHGLGGGVQLPGHLEGLGKQAQLQLQVVKGVLVAGKLHPHKKQAGIVVVVLGGFFNVAAMLQQKARHGMHDAGAVRAGEGEEPPSRPATTRRSRRQK